MDSGDERGFVLGAHRLSPDQLHDLTRVITQLLGVKVWLMDKHDQDRTGLHKAVPFE